MRRFIFICCLLLLFAVSVGLRAESLSATQRHDIFRKVWESVEHWYPYFKEKGVDWRHVRVEYTPRVAAAADDAEFYRLMAEMLRGLRDGHTAVLSYPVAQQPAGMPAMRLVEADGRILVSRVEAGAQAATAGVEPGLQIISVNGRPTEDLIVQTLPTFTASTPAYARHLAVLNLLRGPLHEPVVVGFADGSTLRLSRVHYVPIGYDAAVISRRLEQDIGYLRIPHFRDKPDMVAQVDKALEELRDTRALIIDVRSNPGGKTTVAARIGGRFVKKQTVFASFVRNEYLLGMKIKSPAVTFRVHPRGKWQYTRPVVVLTDPLTFSSAEFFVAGMKDRVQAVVVGQTTAGSSGNPRTFQAGPLTWRVSTWREYRKDGRLVEGHGIAPDVAVTPTVDELRRGVDSSLHAAHDYLRTSLSVPRSSL